jgi:hypothetical protein
MVHSPLVAGECHLVFSTQFRELVDDFLHMARIDIDAAADIMSSDYRSSGPKEGAEGRSLVR